MRIVLFVCPKKIKIKTTALAMTPRMESVKLL
jgi:hypothetical protein